MMTRSPRAKVRAIAVAFLASVFTFVVAPIARGQSETTDPRWQPWLGCWEPAPASSPAQSSVVCVVPAWRSSVVDIVTISDGKEISREAVDASGARRRITKEGCDGWQSAQWSSDSRRVYLRSELTCQGDLERSSSEVFALSPGGEWIDVQSVSAGGGTGVRVMRYRDSGTRTVPTEIVSALAEGQLAVSAARIAAGASLDPVDVVDATRYLEPAVVQAWLIERGQRFQLDGQQLISLEDAGVPGSVTDAMIAVSYPTVFTIDRTTGDEAFRARSISPADSNGSGRSVPVYAGGYYSPLGWGWGPYSYLYGYSPYGFGPGYGWYWNRGPYVIVTNGSGQTSPRGRAVNGRGYTHGDQPSSRGGVSGARFSGPSGARTRRSSGGAGRTARPRR